MEPVDRPRAGRRDAVDHLGRDAQVCRVHEVLVTEVAVAEVEADLDIRGDDLGAVTQALDDALLWVVEVGRIEAFPDADVLADVPLHGELVVGYGGEDLADLGVQLAQVGRLDGRSGALLDEHRHRRDWRRQADLKTYRRRDQALCLERREPRVGVKRRVGEADPRQHEIVGVDRQSCLGPGRVAAGRRWHELQPGGLLVGRCGPAVPAAALAGLAVRDPPNVLAEQLGDAAKHAFGVRERDAADEVHAPRALASGVLIPSCRVLRGQRHVPASSRLVPSPEWSAA